MDQGLETALRGDPYAHILTSTSKSWSNGIYLICKEYLTTGNLPQGIQVVGMPEGCADLAINPYNTPILGDQLDTINELKTSLSAGKLPEALHSGNAREESVWTSVEPGGSVEIITVTVNRPILSPGIPVHYGPMLQEALSGEFHEVGFYRVIDSDSVGRLVAAEAIVLANLGELGTKVNLDCKLVDVETGLMIGAVRRTYENFESALENLSPLVRELGN